LPLTSGIILRPWLRVQAPVEHDRFSNTTAY
jgi:hypothetical protein